MGTEVFVGIGTEGLLNRHLTTLDPCCNEPLIIESLGDDVTIQEG